MEVRVRERLIGALVLVAIVVLVVPAILKGRSPAPAEPSGQPTRRSVPVIGKAGTGGTGPCPSRRRRAPPTGGETKPFPNRPCAGR
jgi:hypothetical protein